MDVSSAPRSSTAPSIAPTAPATGASTKITADKIAELVDSGKGGAMAGMSIPRANVQQFGSVVCLPIGDKPKQLNISYTAQMIAHGVITSAADKVIVACNTASTVRKEACDLLTDFVQRQDKRSPLQGKNTSNYASNSADLAQIKALATDIKAAENLKADAIRATLGAAGEATALNEAQNNEVKEAGRQVIRDKVIGIIEPTATAAANKATKALLQNNKPNYFIVVDSTVGTASSGQYPDKIVAGVENELKGSGYTKSGDPVVAKSENFETPCSVDNESSRIKNEVHVFKNDKTGDTKTLYIQSRGNPTWVPEIEGKGFDQSGTGTAKDSAVGLAQATKNAGLLVKTENSEHDSVFQRAPNLNTLCCTHYPAMKNGLAAAWPNSTIEFLSQDTVVAEMFQNTGAAILTDNSMDNDRSLDITLGKAELGETEQQENHDLINSISSVGRNITTTAIGQPALDQYMAIHADAEFHNTNETDTKSFPPDTDGVLQQNDGVTSSRWKQQLDASNPVDRASPKLVGGAKHLSGSVNVGENEPKTRAQKNMATALSELRQARVRRTLAPAQPTNRLAAASFHHIVRPTMLRVAQIGHLITNGETRGLDILASRQDPGVELFTAATKVATVIAANADAKEEHSAQVEAGHNPEPLKLSSVGIVTGFTVVDGDGNKVAGENDGPPGAVVMAKQILDRGTPVTLVVDSGSEASALAAAKGLGLVQEDNNPEGGARDATFAMATLQEGLTVEVVTHEPGKESTHNVADVKANLAAKNMGLLIAIERPSPDAVGGLSSMSGASISAYNADMSALFTGGEDRSWTTIGIGDGGNEIGTGGAKDDTKTLTKPSGTPVVNNGHKIAAETDTDHMVLASVSNNGGVAMAITTEMILTEVLQPGPTPDPSASIFAAPRNNPAREIVEGYKGIIDSMHANDMSIDGVNKVNAQTVDGRTLHRDPEAGAQEIGTPAATHDDMFDAIIKIFSGKVSSTG